MDSGDLYIKASRYDLKAQAYNRRVFHRHLVLRPWRALVLAVGMGMLGAMAVFNWVDAPQWNRHPWMGWILGGFAFLFVCYFLACVALGWQTPQSNPPDSKS